MTSALVRFLSAGRRCHCALHFAREGGLVGGHLARVLERDALARAAAPTLRASPVPASAPAPAPRAAVLASALEAAAAELAPARLPGDAADAARADYDYRFDVSVDEQHEPHIELREWTNETTTFDGDVVSLVRHVRAGFGQC